MPTIVEKITCPVTLNCASMTLECLEDDVDVIPCYLNVSLLSAVICGIILSHFQSCVKLLLSLIIQLHQSITSQVIDCCATGEFST